MTLTKYVNIKKFQSLTLLKTKHLYIYIKNCILFYFENSEKLVLKICGESLKYVFQTKYNFEKLKN